jgi:hypothetical protein
VIRALRRKKTLRVHCLHGAGATCRLELPEKMLRDVVQPGPAAPAALSKLVRDVDLRRMYIDRAKRNGMGWVDCDATLADGMGCVGVAYTRGPRRMCFVCERQWDAGGLQALLSCLAGWARWCRMGSSLKQCPNPGCRLWIEKNGGCMHMTCRCGHEFHWKTGQPWISTGR